MLRIWPSTAQASCVYGTRANWQFVEFQTFCTGRMILLAGDHGRRSYPGGIYAIVLYLLDRTGCQFQFKAVAKYDVTGVQSRHNDCGRSARSVVHVASVICRQAVTLLGSRTDDR